MLAVPVVTSQRAGLVGDHRPGLTAGNPMAYLKKQIVNVAIGRVLMVLVLATDHRWVRIMPLVYVGSGGGAGAGADHGHEVDGSSRG